MKIWKRFLADQTGAVTVDWVVLTGAVVFLAIFGVTFLRDPVLNLIDAIGNDMSAFALELQGS